MGMARNQKNGEAEGHVLVANKEVIGERTPTIILIVENYIYHVSGASSWSEIVCFSVAAHGYLGSTIKYEGLNLQVKPH